MPTVDAALRGHARRTPHAAALSFEGRHYNYGELDAAVDHACAQLRRIGLRRGERLALAAGNSDRFVIALFAALRAGAIAVPLNPASKPREFDHFLTDSGAAIVAFDRSTAPTVAAMTHAHRRCPSNTPRAAVDLAALIPGADAATLESEASPAGVTFAAAHDSDPDPASGNTVLGGTADALILYTSGTTGAPKGALFDHRRVLAASRAVIDACTIRAADRLLIAAPLSHAAALGVLLIPTVVAGAAAVILPRFEARRVLDTIAAQRISIFFGVPTMYQLLLRETDLTTVDLASWRTALFGGSAMPLDTIEAMRRHLPDLGLIQLCGQTEAGPGGIYSSPAQVVARPSASGHQPLPGSQIRIVDVDGADVGVGGTGEMLLRGESVMKGYWRDPAGTAEVLDGDWLRTGDLVRVEQDGSFTVVDRLKDMIVTGGRNVYSAEVEQVIAAHPAVSGCAVIGEPDALYGESVVAVVELRAGSDLVLSDLQDHCRRHLTGYKIPRRMLVRDIPRTATAKADKVELRAQVSAEPGRRAATPKPVTDDDHGRP